MTTYILYNPLAGNGHHEEKLAALTASVGEGAVCRPITDIQNYADFLAGVTGDDAIILCCGDGTLNRFVNDTEGLDIPCDILYYAMGTGNDFLKDIGKAPDAAPFSVKAYLQNLPTVTLKGHTYRFLNNVGFGIDGYCCEVGDKLKAEKPGRPVNYTSIAINGLLFHFKPVNATVTVDGTEYRYKKVWLAPTMKGRYYGGGMMATLMAFPSIFKGEHIKKTNMVTIHTGRDIRVAFDAPTALQIDGETILGVTEYTATTKVPAQRIL